MDYNKWSQVEECFVDELHAYLHEPEREGEDFDDGYSLPSQYEMEMERDPECRCDYPKTESLFEWFSDVARDASLQTTQNL